MTFNGNYGAHLVTPRGLNSKLINKLVAVQGIVTSASRVKPKLLKSVHYCEVSKKSSTQEYTDKFTLNTREATQYHPSD